MKAPSGTWRAQFPLAVGLTGSKPKLFHFKGVNKEYFSGMSKTHTLTQTNLHKNPKVLRLLSEKTKPKTKQEDQTQNNHNVTDSGIEIGQQYLKIRGWSGRDGTGEGYQIAFSNAT